MYIRFAECFLNNWWNFTVVPGGSVLDGLIPAPENIAIFLFSYWVYCNEMKSGLEEKFKLFENLPPGRRK